MNHPLGRHWSQPNVQDIDIDETHALMDEKSFKELKDYSGASPSGIYEGKMWKRKCDGLWYLAWYGFAEGDFCSFVRNILKKEITQGSATDLPYDDNQYDLSCAFDIIEHIKEDDIALSEMQRVTKP